MTSSRDRASSFAFDLVEVEDRLSRASERAVETAPRRAAVACILRYPEEAAPEVLLMRRAERPSDKWSGHISFPGGVEEEEDETLLHTAMRETHEEVGLPLLEVARHLGPLDHVRAMARGKILPIVIAPYVFHMERSHPLTLNEEAAHAFWLPLVPASRGNFDSVHHYTEHARFPCWNYQGEVIWGLTYKMLHSLLSLLSKG